MSLLQFYPSLNLSKYDTKLLEDTKLVLLNHVKEYSSIANLNNKKNQNTLFALCLKAFEEILPQVELKNNEQNKKSFHYTNEFEQRGLSFLTPFNAATSTSEKNILEKPSVKVQQSPIFNDYEAFDALEVIKNGFQKLIEHNFNLANIQLAFILYKTRTKTPELENEILALIEHLTTLAPAQHFLGFLQIQNYFDKYTPQDGIITLEKVAKLGFTPSYSTLGSFYEDSDIHKSIYYYDTASELGDMYAACTLGYLYLNKLLPVDSPSFVIPLAIKALKKSADAGNKEAAYMLGTIYYEDYLGLGVATENLEKSIYYLRKVEKEIPESVILLGHIYFKLIYDPKYYNHPCNEKYLKMSDMEFNNFLSNNFTVFTKNVDRVNPTYINHPGISIHAQYCMYYLVSGVNSDFLQCFYYLGYFYCKGVEGRVDINYQQGLDLLQKGMESGHKGCEQLFQYFTKEKEKQNV